ncbi:MAG: hypothetical protein WDM80_01150 [Limisphaerales bacterium]
MKTTTLALILFLTALDLWAQKPPSGTAAPTRRLPTVIHTNTNTNNSR